MKSSDINKEQNQTLEILFYITVQCDICSRFYEIAAIKEPMIMHKMLPIHVLKPSDQGIYVWMGPEVLVNTEFVNNEKMSNSGKIRH